MLHGPLDLVWRQRIAECRHVPVERADWPAAVDDGDPVGERLDRVRRAIGEVREVVAVRERKLESDDALWLPGPSTL